MNKPFPTLPQHPRFTEEEQRRFREIFAPGARKYRFISRFVRAIVGICFVIASTGFLLSKIFLGFVGVLFVFWSVLLLFSLIQSELKCPACHEKPLSRDLGSYCPECGAASIQPGGWLRSPRCDSCRKTLRWRKRRWYRVRACTHCGLTLDEKGL